MIARRKDPALFFATLQLSNDCLKPKTYLYDRTCLPASTNSPPHRFYSASSHRTRPSQSTKTCLVLEGSSHRDEEVSLGALRGRIMLSSKIKIPCQVTAGRPKPCERAMEHDERAMKNARSTAMQPKMIDEKGLLHASKTNAGYSVLVPLLVQRPGGRGMTALSDLARVLSHLRKTVHLADRAQLILGLGHVLRLSAPGFQHRGLQRANEREGHVPGRVRHVLGHGLDVLRRLLLRLPARQERDAGHGRRNGLLHHVERVLRDLLRRLLRRVRARDDHRRLEEHALHENAVLLQDLVLHLPNLARHLLRRLDVVVPIQGHLRLNDRDQAFALACCRILSQRRHAIKDGGIRR